ncbi:HMA2 domain-containing protein [Leptolyngbya sp. AN03gr2]|uniref:HMA2 domain-containing protein n=1 Tax=unclassified Leptolyngbya TaxID=2650499 RepID=UPI003D31EEE4
MESVGYQIIHSIAGRIRLRVPWLETDSQSASTYKQLVEAIDSVKTVRINALAQSIVVEYNPKHVPLAKMEDLLIAVMQQVKLTPPAAAPTVEQEPEPENRSDSSEIPVREIPITETPPIEEPIEPILEVPSVEVPAKSSSTSKRSNIPEIPSPWDDEPSLEPNLEKTMTHTIVESSTAELVCSTSTLAKRLKVTSQAITRRRMKSNFGQWTQAQDPEGIAWNYHEDDRLFRPVNSESAEL